MIQTFVQQIIDSYFLKMRVPDISELSDEKNNAPLSEKWACFVTLYHKWEIRWSAGNIKEVLPTLAQELLANTTEALAKDSRFTPIKYEEKEWLSFRVDIIQNRTMLELEEIKKLDPVKNGVIAIKRDYEKLAAILPNISPKLLVWSDFIASLEKKLSDTKLSDKNYIFYKIETEIIRS